jgi:hypothetical protein
MTAVTRTPLHLARTLVRMLELPRSARLVVWTNAWLSGCVALDDVLDAVRGDDEPHEVAGAGGLAAALGGLRANGCTAMRLSLPAPGDPLGVYGPTATTRAVVAAGEAAVAVGANQCLVPDIRPFGPPGDQGHLVSWHAYPVDALPATVGSLAEAERELKEALIRAAGALSALNVAEWRPEVGTALAELRNGNGAERLPEPYPPRAQSVSLQASRLAAVVRIALEDDGGATTNHDARARREALRPVAWTARRALVAACNSVCEPGGPLGPEMSSQVRTRWLR